MEFIIETNGNYLYLSHTFICLKYCGAAIDMWQLVSNTAKPRVENMAETSNWNSEDMTSDSFFM